MKKPSLPFLIVLFVAGALVHKGLAKKESFITPCKKLVNTDAAHAHGNTNQEHFTAKQRFSIHKIVNTTVHYELHLQRNGHLETWKICKGPSSNPLQKRQALKKEPLPLEYLLFEGATLKKPKYKEGVLVWDHGTYSFATEPTESKFSIVFEGTRVKGLYTLEKQNNTWVFQKEEDAFADPRKNITRLFKRSALSGQTLTHILRQAHA
ncbi:hypothetical protein EKK58_10890 [Candidatus Dependentiae bacterium]|nr:MAG: hypothetical protein EKK58_10890 [Candidatus Dependentiae bacterium]